MRGYIRKQGKNSYRITISLGKNPVTGKYEKYQETVRGKKADAEARLAELITQLEKGINIKPEKLTFGEFLDKWLADYGRSNLADSTLRGYANIINLHIKPELGNIPLAKLQPAHLRDFYTKLLREGRKDNKKTVGRQLSPTSVLQVHRVIHNALNHAVKWELIHRNVADAVDPPRKADKEVRVLGRDEAARLLEALRDTYLYLPTLISLTTGLRLGEVLGLTWDDVDLERKTITVSQVQKLKRRTTREETNTLEFGPPKTAKSRRTIAIPDVLVEALKQHRLEQKKNKLAFGPAYQDNGLVCCWPDGSPIHNFTLGSRFRTLARRAGFPISFHALRHTHASLLLSAGEDLKLVSDRLGHTTIRVTADIYGHLTEGRQREAAKKIDELLTEGHK